MIDEWDHLGGQTNSSSRAAARASWLLPAAEIEMQLKWKITWPFLACTNDEILREQLYDIPGIAGIINLRGGSSCKKQLQIHPLVSEQIQIRIITIN